MRTRIAVAGLTVAAGLLGAVPAAAVPPVTHARMNSSTPAPDALLAEPPAAVELTFNRDIAPPASVAVTSPSGRRVGSGEPVVAGAVVAAPIAAKERGTYIVGFRAVSVDGHPITGRFTFSVGHRGPAYTARSDPPGRPSWVVPVTVSGAGVLVLLGAWRRARGRRRDAGR